MDLFENLQIMNESINEDFIKQEREKYGITERSYGTNYTMLELEPTDEAATEFTNKIENDGYGLITTQKDGVEDDVTENDVTLVYGKEVGENRCIIAVSIHPSENSIIVSCGYDEEDGAAEFFESKILKDEKDMEQIVEAKSSSKSNISKMTYKGQKIQNQDWAEFKVGSYVEVINPLNNKSLDITMGISGYGKIAGKVKDTYVYNDGADNLTAGGSNHNYGELNPSADQSCLIEIHDAFKASQHNEKTNRIIVPIEFLKEITEKEYKDIVNKIPRKGFDKMFNKNKKRIESKIIKDEKDMEQIVENKESLKEGWEDPKVSLQEKADKFGAMIDVLGEEMSAYELNEFLKGLTDELDMDIYEDGEPYPCDLDGYFGQPVDELNLNDDTDAELFDWVDEILNDCITKTKTYIESKIETLKGEISALETTIKDLESSL